ncbi:MAG: hypothetical protein ACI9OB_000513, partial [Nonlabens sp.]
MSQTVSYPRARAFVAGLAALAMAAVPLSASAQATLPPA